MWQLKTVLLDLRQIRVEINYFHSLSTGHKKMVEVLLKHGANVNATDEFNSIPLHNVREADVAIAKLLVNAGSNLEVKNIFNRTPLQQFNEDG